MTNTLLGTAKCPACGLVGEPVSWKPGPGYDPAMRKFRCRSCGETLFLIIESNEHLLDIDERVNMAKK